MKYSRETTIELREALNGMAEKEDEICAYIPLGFPKIFIQKA